MLSLWGRRDSGAGRDDPGAHSRADDRAEIAIVELVHTIENVRKQDANAEQLKKSLDLHRIAEWRLADVAAENSMGFHASQESARILGEAIDLARQCQVDSLKLL
jgi:nitrite reductase (cytochrome c-552)